MHMDALGMCVFLPIVCVQDMQNSSMSSFLWCGVQEQMICIFRKLHKLLTSNPLTHTHTHAQVQDARIVEVANDRTDTYLQAIRPQITPQLQLVVIVFPTSRDDRLAMADVTPSWNWWGLQVFIHLLVCWAKWTCLVFQIHNWHLYVDNALHSTQLFFKVKILQTLWLWNPHPTECCVSIFPLFPLSPDMLQWKNSAALRNRYRPR